MKYKATLFSLLFLWASVAIAQQKAFTSLEFKSGFLMDFDEFFKNQSEEFNLDFTDNSYFGFNYASFAVTKHRDGKRIGLELDGFWFDQNPAERRDVNGFLLPDAKWKKFQGQLAFFYGKSIINSDRLDVYIAPLVSLAFRRDSHIPLSSRGFPIINSDALAGIGGKLQGNVMLGDKMGLALAARITALDFIVRTARVENPNLTIRQQRSNEFKLDLLRSDGVIQFGLFFKI